MKKLLVAIVILVSSLALTAPNTARAATANPATITISDAPGPSYQLSDDVIEASIGDTFTLINETFGGLFLVDEDTASLYYTNPPLGGAPDGCNVTVCMSDPDETLVPDLILRVDAFGTIDLIDSGTLALFATVTFVPRNARNDGHPGVRHTVTFDLNGGVCREGVASSETRFRGSMALPTKDDCSKDGYQLVGWTRDPAKTSDENLLTQVVARSGTLTAVWRPIPEAPGAAAFLVNFLCGPCTRAAFVWEPSATSGVTYLLEVTGPTGTTTYPTSELTLTIENLIPGRPYSVTIVSVKDGVRSDASSAPGRTYEFTLKSEVDPFIFIVGSRGSDVTSLPSEETCSSYVLGPPRRTVPTACVVVEGDTEGLAEGTLVTPQYRFPGQTSYTDGTPVKIGEDGKFIWFRKTGKKIYVQFAVGDVYSNRVIIPAK